MRTPLQANRVAHQHEGRGIITLKPLTRALLEDRWGGCPKGLAVLNVIVADILHVGATWTHDDAPIAENSRSLLRASLEPANHLTLSDEHLER